MKILTTTVARILIQKKARLSCLFLASLLIIFVFTIHLPGVIGGNQASMSSLLKDTALAGAALGFANIYVD